MKIPLLPHCTPIGIDISRRSIKAAQLRRTSSGWQVKAAAVLPRREPGAAVDPEESRWILATLSRQGFSGARATLAAPSEKIMTGLVELPPAGTGAPFDQMVRMEFARVHRRDPESFELVCWPLPQSPARKTKSHLYAAAYGHADADELLDTLAQGGLSVEAVDTRSRALARACAPVLFDDSRISGILEVAWDRADLIILYGGVIVYERVLPDAGMCALSRPLSGLLGIDEDTLNVLLADPDLGGNTAEARSGLYESARGIISQYYASLAGELHAPFSYVAQQYPDSPAGNLLLAGDGASMRGLPEHLARALAMEVRVVSLTDLAECPRFLLARCSTGALTTAFGLAKFGK